MSTGNSRQDKNWEPRPGMYKVESRRCDMLVCESNAVFMVVGKDKHIKGNYCVKHAKEAYNDS